MESTRSFSSLAERLRQAGLRATPQRLAVYRTLLATDTHPTAQALFDKLRPSLPSLSQATVYNTLQALAENGLILEIGTAGDGTVHYDADLRPHINLICTGCHQIEDIFDASIDGNADDVVARSGFLVHGKRISYYGLCPRCQDAE